MAYRSLTGNQALDDSIQDTLLNNKEYILCHLVKFERPIVDRIKDATSYAYFCDGPYDISFDDGSSNIIGEPNGQQTYIANTLKSVGDVKETVEAKASTTSIVLNSTAFGTSITDTFTITSTTLESNFDLVKAGFREGDRVQLTSSNAAALNRNQFITLGTFSSSNKVVQISTYKDSYIKADSSKVYTMSLQNTAISAFVDSKTVTNYTSYINRDVFIYRLLLNPSTGAIIGQPFLIMRGMIAGGKLNEDPSKGSTMTWTITSHWGNFVKVEGRRAVDSAHRQTAAEKLRSAVQASEYEEDLGFVHSNKSLSVLAPYQTREERFRIKKKKKWGIKKTKVKRYYVDVDREQRLDFNLDQEYIPVVYGVQRLDSNIVFADVLKRPSDTVLFKVNTLCEGEIGGILNLISDDKSLVCINAEDQLDRYGNATFSNGASNISSGDRSSITCFGRMDQGDVLTATQILHPLTIGVTTTANGDVNDGVTLTVTDSSPTSTATGLYAAAGQQIRAGALVEYTGGDEDLYVTNVSGNTLTLSQNATIADGTSLTFKHQYPRYPESNTNTEFIHFDTNTDLFNLGAEAIGPQPIYHTPKSESGTADGFWNHERALAHKPVETMWQLHTGKPDQETNKILSSVAQGYAANGKGTLICTSVANAQKFQIGQSYIIQSGSEVVGNNDVPFTVLSIDSATVTIKFGVKLLKSQYKYRHFKGKKIYYPRKNLTASTQNETYTIRKYAGPSTKKSARFFRKKPKTGTFTVDITETTVTTAGNASFRIQHMYYNDQEDNYEYWGENHRLLDTAYTMSITKNASGSPLTDTDDCEYVIKGKFINCHNYDNSFEITNSTDLASFKAGDAVTIGSGATLKTISDLVCSASFKQAGTEKILIANREKENNVAGTRIYTLNQSTSIREEATIFLPYLIKDMWVDETGTYLWTVDTALAISGIQDTTTGGRVRRFTRTLGDNAGTNATITLTHNTRLGGMVPADGAERLIEPGGIWGDGNQLFVYYPATIAQPAMSTGTYADNIQSFSKINTQKSYLVKFDITGHAAETGELSTGVSDIVDIVHSGDNAAELPLNSLNIDGNPNLNVLISGVDQPNYSHELVVNNPASMASDGTTLWVLDKQLDANHSYSSLSGNSSATYTGADYIRNSALATFHLLKKQNSSASYFNYSEDNSANILTANFNASKFGTGNIYAFNVADGTRDRSKDILITKDACKDGCFLGHFAVTNGTRVQRTGGAAAPLVGDFIEDMTTSSALKINENATERNLTDATRLTIDAVYGIPASNGLSKDPTDPTAVQGTYNLTSADYTYSATSPLASYQPTIQVVVNSSGIVTGITVGDNTTVSIPADGELARLFQVGHTVTITAGKLGTGSAAHTFTVTALTHYTSNQDFKIAFGGGLGVTCGTGAGATNGNMACGTLSTGYGNRASHIAYHGNKLYVLNAPFVNIGHYRAATSASSVDANAWVNVWSTTNKRWESDYFNITGGVNTATTRIDQNFSGIAVDSTHLYVAAIQATATGGQMNATTTDLKYPKITRYQLSDKAYQSTNCGYMPAIFSIAGNHALQHSYGLPTGFDILPGVTQTIDSVTVPVFVSLDTLGSFSLGTNIDGQYATGSTSTTTSKIFITNHYTSGSTTNWSRSYDFGIPKTDLRNINLNKAIGNFTLCDITATTTDKLFISQALVDPMGGPFNLFTGKIMFQQRLIGEPHFTPSAYVEESTTVGSQFTGNGLSQTTTNRPLVYEDYENIVVLNKATTQGAAATNASAFTANNYYKGGNRFRINTEENHAAPTSGLSAFTCQADVSNSATFVVNKLGSRPEIGHTFYHPDPGNSDAQKGHTITAIGFTEESAGQLHGADTTAGKDGTVDIRCSISEAVADVSDTTIVVTDRTGMPTNFPFAACLEKHDKFAKEVVEVTSLDVGTNTYTVARNIGYMQTYSSDFSYSTDDFLSIPKELVVYNKTSGSAPDVSGDRDSQLYLEITSEDGNNKTLETLSDGTTKPGLKVQHIGLLPNVADHYAILLSSPITVQVNRAAKLGHRNSVTVTPNITIDQNDIVYAGSNNAVQYQLGGYTDAGDMNRPATFSTATFDFDDGHFTGVMLREAEVLYFSGKDKIKGIAYNGGHNILDEFPDGGSIDATIKSIKQLRRKDGSIGARISFTNPVPFLGQDSITITSTEDTTKTLTVNSGDVFPSEASTLTLESVDTKGGLFKFLTTDAHTNSGACIEFSSFGAGETFLGLPLEIVDATYEELSYGKVKAVAANFGTNLHADNAREFSVVANFIGAFNLKTLSTLREEETLIYVSSELGEESIATAKVLPGPGTLDILDWKTESAFVYPYTAPVIEFNSATKVNTTDETIELTAEQYRNLSENERVTYSNNGNTSISGLVNGRVYYVNKVASTTKIKLTLAFDGSSTSAYSTSYINLTNAQSGTHKLTPEQKIVLISHEATKLYNADSTIFSNKPKLSFKDIIRLKETQLPNVNSNELIGFRANTTDLYSSQVTASDYTTRMSMIKDHNLPIDGTTKYKIFRKEDEDQRVSINPAMQLLDYLTNDVYGKGLDIETEIDLDSFKEAARLCDAESSVTLIAPKIHPLTGAAVASPTVGEVWASVFNSGRHTTSPPAVSGHFIGTVAAVNTRVVDEKEYWEITFTNCIGKMGRKWNEWQSLADNFIWNNGGAFYGPPGVRQLGTTVAKTNLGTGLALTQNPSDAVGGTGNLGNGGATSSASGNTNGTTGMGDTGGAPVTYTANRLVLKTAASGNYAVNDILYLDNAKNGVAITITSEQYYASSGTSGTTVDSAAITDSDQVGGVALNISDSTGVEVGMYFYKGRRYGVVTSIESSTQIKIRNLSSSEFFGSFAGSNATETLALTSPITDPNRVTFEGNPLVKSFNQDTQTFSKNGYSLYDCDDVLYWRYVGWDEKEQHMATRHQTNMIINTATTIFDNVNTILQQFNGILSYSGGRYKLGVETTKAPDVSTTHSGNTFTPSHITEDQIIGKIDITDKGAKNSINSINAKITDPYKLFGQTEINFFNSDYLIQDNNVPKDGSFDMPGVTNYFNARMGVKQELDSSRFSLDIAFTMAPEGILLKAGEIITVTYDRFGFDAKQFRIKSMTLKSDGLVSIIASEHSDTVYILEHDGTTSVDTVKNVAGDEILDPTV